MIGNKCLHLEGCLTMDETKRLLAALGYPIWIVALVVVLTEKKDKEAKLHGMQGLFMGLAAIALWFCVMILSIILSMIPMLGAVVGLLLSLVMMVVWLGWFVYAIICAINCYNGKPVNIPVITPMAKKYVK